VASGLALGAKVGVVAAAPAASLLRSDQLLGLLSLHQEHLFNGH
jgi:hypothetical protein